MLLAPARGRRPLKEKSWAQYLVAIHLPDDFDASSADKRWKRYRRLNEEMEAKSVRLFAGGLRPAREAKSLRTQPDGKVLVTDGPYLETKEHVGGFGYWKPLTWTKHWRGHVRPSSRAGRRLRCVLFFLVNLTALLARRRSKEGMTQYWLRVTCRRTLTRLA